MLVDLPMTQKLTRVVAGARLFTRTTPLMARLTALCQKFLEPRHHRAGVRQKLLPWLLG